MQIEYTVDMIDELKKCSDDPVYFISKYITLRNEKSGDIISTEKEFDTVNAFNNDDAVVLYSRNISAPTVAAYFLWCALFKYKQSFVYMSKDLEKSQKFLTYINQMYEHVPSYIKCTRDVSYQYKIATGFENGCKILTAIPSNISCVTRGLALSIVFIDDYLECVELVKEPLYTIMPALQPGGKIIQNCVA